MGLFGFGLFDHVRQSRFGAAGGVGMDDLFRTRAIKALCRDAEFLLSRFDVTGGGRSDDLFDLSTHRTLDCLVGGLADFVLTKPLGGTG